MRQERLKIADNNFIEGLLSKKSKRQFRLVHVFTQGSKKVSQKMYKDVREHPYKLLFFTTFPTTTTAATLCYISLGLTEKTRKDRHDLAIIFKEQVNYKLYQNFISARFEGGYDVDVYGIIKHLYRQGWSRTMQKLYTTSDRLEAGWIKSNIQCRLKKRMIKGEVALI